MKKESSPAPKEPEPKVESKKLDTKDPSPVISNEDPWETNPAKTENDSWGIKLIKTQEDPWGSPIKVSPVEDKPAKLQPKPVPITKPVQEVKPAEKAPLLKQEKS